MSGFCQLWLTCDNKAEANKIAKALLERKLVACAKQIDVNSQFHWKGQVESENETLLLMESREDLFEQTQKEVAKWHSYETFVLTATPMTKLSKDAQKWLDETLKK